MSQIQCYAQVEVPGYATQTIPLYVAPGEVAEMILDAPDAVFLRLGTTVFRSDQIAFIRLTEAADA